MRFLGRLQVDGSGSGWLRAEVRVERHRVALLSAGEELGTWPVSAVAANRQEGDRFELFLGNDRVMFAADDALAFSYDALPVLTKSGGLGAVMSSLRSVLGSREREGQTDSTAAVGTAVAVEEDPFPSEEVVPDETKSRLRDLVEAARRPSLITDEVVDENQERLDFTSLDLKDEEEAEEPSWLPRSTTLPVSPPGNGSWLSSARSPEPSSPEPSSPPLTALEDVEKAPDAYHSNVSPPDSDEEPLNKLYLRLQQAIDDVEAGALSPQKATAIAELAKAMCFAVYAGSDERIEELADRLIETR